jgi:hypothetical protein
MGSLGLPVREGNEYSMSGKEFEVDCPISRDDFISGSCFGLSAPSTFQHKAAPSASRLSKQFVPLQQNANSGKLANAAMKNDREVMPLQPVNFVSYSDGRKSTVKAKIENSYWTACWCDPLQPVCDSSTDTLQEKTATFETERVGRRLLRIARGGHADHGF